LLLGLAACEGSNVGMASRGQDIAGKHYYRPRDAKAQEKYKAQFSPVKLFTIDEVFGGWTAAHEVHFKDGGIFDQIYAPQ